ncbi:MAG: hypothetical protein ACFFD4_07990 [Candidatus Odinarchaeota archaeon]
MLKHFEKLQETPLTRFFDLQFRSLEGMLDRDLVRLGHDPLRWKDGTICKGSNPCNRCGLWRRIA